MDLPEDIQKKFKEYGRIGGKRTAAKLGKEHYSRIGKISAERKAKLKQSNLPS